MGGGRALIIAILLIWFSELFDSKWKLSPLKNVLMPHSVGDIQTVARALCGMPTILMQVLNMSLRR